LRWSPLVHFLAALALLIVATSLHGCGGGEPQETPEEQKAAAKKALQEKEQKKLDEAPDALSEDEDKAEEGEENSKEPVPS